MISRGFDDKGYYEGVLRATLRVSRTDIYIYIYIYIQTYIYIYIYIYICTGRAAERVYNDGYYKGCYER